MLTDFASRFDSYYSAYSDLRLYDQCKSYRYEGDDYRLWEPTDPVDIEIEQPLELDEYDGSDCAEF